MKLKWKRLDKRSGEAVRDGVTFTVAQVELIHGPAYTLAITKGREPSEHGGVFLHKEHAKEAAEKWKP